MSTKMTFTGFEELDREFERLPEAVQKQGLRKATRAVAKVVLAEAKLGAPEDTGQLVSSLKVKATRRSRKNKHTVGTSVETREGLFKGEEFYGGFLELGTKERATKSGARRGRIDETVWAFLRPALYSNPGRKLRIFRVSLARWLQSYRPKVRPAR